jgi:DNA (cytosine-5)-methyltransferase 1
MKTIAAIDLFAGPGGLSEGFSRYQSAALSFDIRLSIEKDPVACRTLRLRAFLRQFKGRRTPVAFYDYIRGNRAKLQDLEALPEWKIAAEHVKQWTLGASPSDPGYVAPTDLHQAINLALSGAGDEWVLLGGPPCQAYSLIGRARMTGVGAKVRSVAKNERQITKSREAREAAFSYDRRHTLYREYLRVVAVHQPAAFVMENVKGILSAKIPVSRDDQGNPQGYVHVFDQIQKDLTDPWAALSDDPDHKTLHALSGIFGHVGRTYRLYSFVLKPEDAWTGLTGTDFVIRTERFGVPQNRHRVIVLGIRQDIKRDYEPIKEAVQRATVRQMICGMPRLRSGLSRDRASVTKYGDDSPCAWRFALRSETKAALKGNVDLQRSAAINQVLDKTAELTSRGGPYIASLHSTSSIPNSLRYFLEDSTLGGVIQHHSRSHMASDLARYLYLAVTADKSDVSQQYTPTLEEWPRALLPKHANVRYDGRQRVVDGFVDRFKVQSWDKPSSTITSHIQKDGHYFIHPDPSQCRSLTVREAARLQTFPENYFFEGNRTEQFLQVGNAVPPYLALQLAESVANIFEG